MNKITCRQCGKTLLYIFYGELEIKCPRCGLVNKIKIDKQRQEPIVRTANKAK